MPAVEKVRFTASGATAALLAVQIARAYTNRSTVIKFSGHYHSWYGDIALEQRADIMAGVPKESLTHVIVAPLNIEVLDQMLYQTKDVAAVIVDPLGPGIGNDCKQIHSFLHQLRSVTEGHGVVMILDEAVSGFRLSRGGAQVRFNIIPDLTIMGKIVTGGLPGGALGGRDELMGILACEDTSKRIIHKSSWNANPLTAVAGSAALGIIEREPINKHADQMANRLCEGINHVCNQSQVACSAHNIASEVFLKFRAPCDDKFKLAMLLNGVHTWHTWALHVSAAHQAEHIDRTIIAVEQSFKMLMAEELL
jgi:glutamate-1-semialdehyde 2,1-aminomutase